LSDSSTERERAQFWRNYDIMQARATAYCPLNKQRKQTGQFVPLVCFLGGIYQNITTAGTKTDNKRTFCPFWRCVHLYGLIYYFVLKITKNY